MVPGYGKEDVEVGIDKDIIEITGDLGESGFTRKFKKPENVEWEEAKASVSKGIFVLEMPLSNKETKVRIIKVTGKD